MFRVIQRLRFRVYRQRQHTRIDITQQTGEGLAIIMARTVQTEQLMHLKHQ